MRRLVMLFCILICGTSVGFGQEDGWPTIALTPLVTGLSAPTYATDAGDGSGRLFIVEQRGTIRIFQGGALLEGFFLDIRDRVFATPPPSERGLFSIAFPVSFPDTQQFYVYYTSRPAGDITISRFFVSAEDPNVADPSSEQIILMYPHPRSNHNGGQLQFGPGDGYLYIGTGDGGGAGDPDRAGQDIGVIAGKLLRIDVESGEEPYGIPPDNPFVGVEGAREEIWAYGLRNPWRFSFDSVNWDLYIADVGQNAREEVDFQPWDSTGGENYGWSVWEGSLCFRPMVGCEGEIDNHTFPVAEYPHAGGDCSITGGFVYRGKDFPGMYGIYFYADYCTGRIWGLRYDGEAWQTRLLAQSALRPSSFGKDENGNLLLADQLQNRILIVTELASSCSESPEESKVEP